MNFERRDNGYYVADDDEGNTYGLLMQPFGGWIVMRNERAVGSAPDLAAAKAEARNHRATSSDECRCTGDDVAVHNGWFRCTPESRAMLAQERKRLEAAELEAEKGESHGHVR